MKAKTKFTRLWSILLALVMVVGMIPIAALAEEPDAAQQFADAPGEYFYRNDGGYDSEGPTVDTTFTLTEPTMITGIWTYHWYAANYDIDFSRQTIQLKDTATNTVVYSGAVRVGHIWNVRNCDWIVLPNIVLPTGTYQVIDSHNESWCALNSKGVCMVKGYSAPTYTVTFDANGGTGEMEAATGVSGKYTLPANGFTAPEGKQFKCWSVDGSEKAVGDKITVTANTTVKAVWENITYTVSFDSNGGTGTMTAQTGVLGDYTLPANGFTAPAGKQFKAWSVNGNEKAVGDKITVTADTTVKAVWENIPAAPTEYNILDGANSKWTHDSDGNLSVKGSGEFSKFVGVKVDGKTVDEKYYTVKEGSTIVTLKPEYLNTLTAGKHTLEIVWTDGTADTTFTVDAKPVNTDTKSPQTADNSSIALWIALLFVSAAGVLSTAVLGKKSVLQGKNVLSQT